MGTIYKLMAERERDGNPIKVALIGAGFSGRNITYQILKSVPSMRVVAIASRTLKNARDAYRFAGVYDIKEVDSVADLHRAAKSGWYAITEHAEVVCEAENIDAVIECTGTIDYAAEAVLRAIRHGKNIVLANAELDATVGPILKTYAEKHGVVYSNIDGDEPGVAMHLIRYVRALGLTPVVAGNLKGLYDPYRNPETQRELASKLGQNPAKLASFADGTKLSMEMAVLSNGTGFRAGKRGMYGPSLGHVDDSKHFFRDKLLPGGMVDFLVGASPATGVFVLAFSEDPVKADYLRYLKMGDGPLYVFYKPYHLPQMETPLTVARAVLLNDATIAPLGAPVCDVVTFAKRNLKAGELLDGMGGFTCYSLIDNWENSLREGTLPMGVSEGCRLKRDVEKDCAVKYADVELPAKRLRDELREEQEQRFR